MVHDDEDAGLPDISNREILRVLSQEIADTHRELSGDIQLVGKRFDSLEEKVDQLSSDVHTLRLEVHQNQSTFITNHASLEKRVTALEMAA